MGDWGRRPPARLRAAETIGLPVGDKPFIARLERLTKHRPQPGDRGPELRPQDETQRRPI